MAFGAPLSRTVLHQAPLSGTVLHPKLNFLKVEVFGHKKTCLEDIPSFLNELHCNTGNNFGKIEILTTTVNVMLGHLSNNILERSIKDEEKPSTLSLFSLSQTFSRFLKPSQFSRRNCLFAHSICASFGLNAHSIRSLPE